VPDNRATTFSLRQKKPAQKFLGRFFLPEFFGERF
jgi:hypothetical protein